MEQIRHYCFIYVASGDLPETVLDTIKLPLLMGIIPRTNLKQYSYLDICKSILLENFVSTNCVSQLLQVLCRVEGFRHFLYCLLWECLLKTGEITLMSIACWACLVLAYQGKQASFWIVYLKCQNHWITFANFQVCTFPQLASIA